MSRLISQILDRLGDRLSINQGKCGTNRVGYRQQKFRSEYEEQTERGQDEATGEKRKPEELNMVWASLGLLLLCLLGTFMGHIASMMRILGSIRGLSKI